MISLSPSPPSLFGGFTTFPYHSSVWRVPWHWGCDIVECSNFNRAIMFTFEPMPLGKGMSSLYPYSYSLNTTSTVLLQGWPCHSYSVVSSSSCLVSMLPLSFSFSLSLSAPSFSLSLCIPFFSLCLPHLSLVLSLSLSLSHFSLILSLSLSVSLSLTSSLSLSFSRTR